mmetsp:Transcript_32782/g.57040  ORF Transcript_32782/g.57040 Transcript_32782/m.57040 type:complete len:209 (-) Transcript_32782:5147-5773(-)
MLLWLLINAARACFLATCVELDDEVCAKAASDTELWVNADGCDGECSVLEVYTLGVGDTLACPADFTYSFSLDWSYSIPFDPSASSSTDLDCGIRGSTKALASGSHPKQCEDSDDCLLKEGSSLPCECALDGKSYCVPDESSSFYDEFWVACAEGNFSQYSYWVAFLAIFPLNVNVDSCLYDTFSEFKQIEEDDAAFLSVTVTLWWML